MTQTRSGHTPPTLTAQSLKAAASGKLWLLVIGEGGVQSFPLPDAGPIMIGRAVDADVRIDDPLVSRRHAVLHVGERLEVEDCESQNGVRVHGERVPKRGRRALTAEASFEVGPFLLVVQHRSAEVRVRRLWDHDYFEGRLSEECLRSARSGQPFTLLRVVCPPRTLPSLVPEVLGKELRALDVFGLYAPHDYEVLLVDTPLDQAQLPVRRLVEALRHAGVEVEVGLAGYPQHGRDPDSLLAQAGRLGGAAPEPQPLVPSSTMKLLHELVERVARSNLSVLILGETGVGKEVMAETVHRLSPRRDQPFLRLNCAALTESLLESELFGHEKGAFTGAVATKKGLLETAEGGTVFIDEVGELPMSAQVKLLRVLEERRVLRVGGLKSLPIDVRFVAATNRDLEAEIARGNFRQDLYFRLNGVTINIPPLRERVDEIDGLLAAFVPLASREAGRDRVPIIANEAMRLLKSYSWPGNIRELRNVIQRAVLLAGNTLEPEHLPLQKMKATFATVSAPPPEEETRAPADDAWDEEPTLPPRTDTLAATMRSELRNLERTRIQEALDACAGNQTRAAQRLGISRRTLINRMIEFGMPRPRKS